MNEWRRKQLDTAVLQINFSPILKAEALHKKALLSSLFFLINPLKHTGKGSLVTHFSLVPEWTEPVMHSGKIKENLACYMYNAEAEGIKLQWRILISSA